VLPVSGSESFFIGIQDLDDKVLVLIEDLPVIGGAEVGDRITKEERVVERLVLAVLHLPIRDRECQEPGIILTEGLLRVSLDLGCLKA